MSLYEVSEFCFFSSAPDSLIQSMGRREWGIPARTMPRSFSDCGSRASTYDEGKQDRDVHYSNITLMG